jgi:predicted restriction endonuclease
MKRNWTDAKEKVKNEGMCRVCGNSEILDPAHIIPRSLGGDMNAANIIPLCRTCHSEYDAHRLDILPFLKRAEEERAVMLIGIARAYRIITGEINDSKNTEDRNSGGTNLWESA